MAREMLQRAVQAWNAREGLGPEKDLSLTRGQQEFVDTLENLYGFWLARRAAKVLSESNLTKESTQT